jgi:TM2 domain-containing membrane protein YozV
MALAARLALEQLVHDDSRSVGAAATGALAAGPKPDTAAPSPKTTPEPRAYSQPTSAHQGDSQGYQQQSHPQPDHPPSHQKESVYDAAGRLLSDKRQPVAGWLQIFLGAFGAGRFYAGHTRIALAQLTVTIVTIPLLGIGGVIWGLVDGITILDKGGTDAQGRILRP